MVLTFAKSLATMITDGCGGRCRSGAINPLHVAAGNSRRGP